VYRAAVPPAPMIRREIRRFLDSLFDGAAEPLVAHLTEMEALSLDDLRDLEASLRQGRRDDEESDR
jgi:predicted transcriptional regulator